VGALATLSMQVDDVEAVPEGIFEVGENGRFTAIATAYVAIGSTEISFPDSFPVQVYGHFTPDGAAIVDKVSVDTASLNA
jgi:hypothetical protein